MTMKEYRCLALSLIKDAIKDACKPTIHNFNHSKNEALQFLRGVGNWAKSKSFWCRIAEVNEQALNKRLKELNIL